MLEHNDTDGRTHIPSSRTPIGAKTLIEADPNLKLPNIFKNSFPISNRAHAAVKFLHCSGAAAELTVVRVLNCIECLQANFN